MTPSKCSLLVVDDEPHVRTTLVALLGKEFEVVAVDSAEAARALLEQRAVDLVLADQHLPGQTGVQLLEWVHHTHPHTARLLMTGLGTFEDAVEAINCGRVSRFLFKPWRANDLLQTLRDAARTAVLERSHDQLLEQLRTLNTELEERVHKRTQELEEANHELQQKNWMLEKLALTDPLTGLPNRRAMDRLIRAELRRRARYPGPLAIGIVDVDHFKEVNARYLLPGGDQVLIGLSRTLAGAVRSVDSVGRIGGEEFEIVAPETNRDGAAALAERIRSSVEAGEYLYQNQVIRITVSVGFCVAEADAAADLDQFKHVAAAALAEAKDGGRNRCVVRPAEGAADPVG